MEDKTYFQISNPAQHCGRIAVIDKNKFQDFITAYTKELHVWLLKENEKDGYKSLEHKVEWVRSKTPLFANLILTEIFEGGNKKVWHIELEECRINEFQITEKIIKI